MKIKNFFSFINESVKTTVPFQFSNRWCELIYEIDSPISDDIFNHRYQPSDISLIDFSENPGMVSFTTSDKLAKHFDSSDDLLKTLIKPLYNSDAEIYHKMRSDIKVGRFVNKLFGDKYSNAEIHKFVNKYKSVTVNTKLEFEYYEKFKIKEGYRSIKYTSGPSGNELTHSCMNDKLDYIDFYVGCPVKLLVLRDSNHIFGRALVWELSDGDTFMDRVYVANQHDYWKFINYAKKMKWWWKSENKSGDEIKLTNGDITKRKFVSVDLNFNFDDYKDWGVPFLDTFVYARDYKLYNYIPNIPGRFYKLNATDGTCDVEYVDDF